MKISLDWLNRYLDQPVSADQAERLLSAQGLPIESREAAGDDLVLDVEVTSNRSDCLSHVGVAREIAAGSDRRLKLPDAALPSEAEEPAAALTSVVNEREDLCPVYTARVIRGVKVGPSPAWLVKRLEAIGLRGVNNVVDVTNFVLMEMGQPLHAFDLARLAGRRIVVRAAKAGEGFTAIDGTKHTLTDQMLVIADAARPVAVAGVMGGLDSEVGAATTDVLLESAQFAPLSVRRTSRRLKLSSDSSHRFERGIDPRGVERASRRAAALIVELAGGALAQGVLRAGADEPTPRAVTMRVARCNSLLGLAIPPEHMVNWLERLGLEPHLDPARQTITCRIPTHRLDLAREVDIIEEVARLHGVEDVPVSQRIHIVARAAQPHVAARQQLGRVLTAHGYHETVNFSFIAPRLGELFVPADAAAVMIDDERRKAEPMLRPSLLPSLMACRKSNQDVGNADLRLFEAASTWTLQQGRIVERRMLALLCDAPNAQHAVRDVRGTIEELIRRLAGSAVKLEFKPMTQANFNAAAGIVLDGAGLGIIGAVDRPALERFDLQTPVAAAELEMDPLLAPYPPTVRVAQLPRFPGIERDLSIIVREQIAWDQIEQEIRAANPALLETLDFVTTYRGKPIAKGFKSATLRLTFRDPQTTLRHDQVDVQIAAVVQRLKETLAAELRV